LFAFAVQLLDLPAKAARLLCGFCGILSQVVGHDKVRAVGRHLNPEQVHLMVFGKAFDFDPLAVGQGLIVPVEGVHTPASITASATFGHSASPDNVTCWYSITLQ
jgi:hypothetical protein